MNKAQKMHTHFSCSTATLKSTVKPPNKGHFGNNINSTVVHGLCREVGLFSEVQNVLKLKGNH